MVNDQTDENITDDRDLRKLTTNEGKQFCGNNSSTDDCGYVTPSPTFDFPPFSDDCLDGLDGSRADDNTSLISLETQSNFFMSNEEMAHAGSLIDTSPQSQASDLPSPLKPAASTTEDYHGFTLQGSTIQTIPCNTGDLFQQSSQQQQQHPSEFESSDTYSTYNFHH